MKQKLSPKNLDTLANYFVGAISGHHPEDARHVITRMAASIPPPPLVVPIESVDPRYIVGCDHGHPGGDRSVEVVYDTEEKRVISIRDIGQEEPTTAAGAIAMLPSPTSHLFQREGAKAIKAAREELFKKLLGGQEPQKPEGE